MDDREKKPLSFPSHIVCLDRSRSPTDQRTIVREVQVIPQTLVTGDYMISNRAVVERKGALTEVAKNCLTSDGRRRFVAACDRLSQFPRRLLLLEGSLSPFPQPVGDKEHPGLACDALLDIIGERGIDLMVLPVSTPAQRRGAGEWALRWLLSQEKTDAYQRDLVGPCEPKRTPGKRLDDDHRPDADL